VVYVRLAVHLVERPPRHLEREARLGADGLRDADFFSSAGSYGGSSRKQEANAKLARSSSNYMSALRELAAAREELTPDNGELIPPLSAAQRQAVAARASALAQEGLAAAQAGMLVSGLSVSMRSSSGSIGSPFHSSGRSPLQSSARSPCHSSGRRHSFTQSASHLQAVHSSSQPQAVHSFTQSAPSISPSSLGMGSACGTSPSKLGNTYPPTSREAMSKLGNGEGPRRESDADGRDDQSEHRDQRYRDEAHRRECLHRDLHREAMIKAAMLSSRSASDGGGGRSRRSMRSSGSSDNFRLSRSPSFGSSSPRKTIVHGHDIRHHWP